ncbi:hypothetical protein HPB50_022617 [Hyalomma asiaticum]|uniref:Uncharacterized protein n=1 Tax=Hyalomma asiaticum TaxID=266040 RepID=A0ACB7TLL3_HYAAI|nr:hypothetical protein HPB50_022617 [Hyalomma asiaticum]
MVGLLEALVSWAGAAQGSVPPCRGSIGVSIVIHSGALQEHVSKRIREDRPLAEAFQKDDPTTLAVDEPQASTTSLAVHIEDGEDPRGHISYVSQAYGGRASDSFITKESKVLEKFLPSIDSVMVDKGFLIDKLCLEHHVTMVGDRSTCTESSVQSNEVSAVKKRGGDQAFTNRTTSPLSHMRLCKYSDIVVSIWILVRRVYWGVHLARYRNMWPVCPPEDGCTVGEEITPASRRQ